MPNDWQPDVRGEAGPAVTAAFQRAFDQMSALLARVSAIDNLHPISAAAAAKQFGPAAVSAALQAGGSNPLNLQNLIGQAAEPQFAYVPDSGLVLPDVLGSPLSQDRQLIVRNGQLYVFNGASQPGLWTAVGINTLVDTHAHRLDATNFPQYQATNLAVGTLFYETDRTVFYIVKLIANVNTWVYAAGEMSSASSTVADIPVDLGANDVGFLYNSTFWDHKWIFLNTGPTGYWYAPGDPGSNYIVATPTLPIGGKWGVCDGSAYSFIDLHAVGTAITTPDLMSGAFIRGGPYDGPGVTGASRAKWEAAAITDDESLHSHVTNVNGTVTVDGGSALIAATPAGYPTSVTTPHHHTLSDTLAQLKLFTDANGGLPPRIQLNWYIRL